MIGAWQLKNGHYNPGAELGSTLSISSVAEEPERIVNNKALNKNLQPPLLSIFALARARFSTDPVNVVPGNMNMIYFDIMIPKLLAWGKNKDYETKRNIATETFKKVFILLGEKTQIFFENPGKTEYPIALYAIRCFAVITAPFLNSLSSWNKGHPQSAFAFETNRPFRDLQYYFEEINKTLRII